MNKEDRKKVYIDLKTLYENNVGRRLMNGFCGSLNSVSGNHSKDLNDYPELLAQKPTETYGAFLWWNLYKKDGREKRIAALEKAIELCK